MEFRGPLAARCEQYSSSFVQRNIKSVAPVRNITYGIDLKDN
jgi:hypothetical protein